MTQRRQLKANIYETSYVTRDSFSLTGDKDRQSVLDWSKITTEKREWYKPDANVNNKVNIIPFTVTSELHPLVWAKKIEIGDLDFQLDVFVHPKIGPDENVDILCPRANYDKKCPICERFFELLNEGKKDESKRFQPRRKCFININPIKPGETKLVKSFEVAHYLFSNDLIEAANACIDGAGMLPFADLDGGKTIQFLASEEKLGKRTFLKYKNFNFLDRQPISDELFNQAISFDKGLVLLTYEQIEDIMYGKAVAVNNPTQTQPTEQKKEQPTTESVQEPVKSDGCPHGHVWGADCDEHKECHTCSKWDMCIEQKSK